MEESVRKAIEVIANSMDQSAPKTYEGLEDLEVKPEGAEEALYEVIMLADALKQNPENILRLSIRRLSILQMAVLSVIPLFREPEIDEGFIQLAELIESEIFIKTQQN